MPHCAGRCAHNGRCHSERFETTVVCERYSIALYTLGRWQLEEFPSPSPARRVVLEPGLGSPPPAEVEFDLLLDRRVDMDAAAARCLRLPATMTVGDCALLFSIHRCKQAFVTEHGRLVGLVSFDKIDQRRHDRAASAMPLACQHGLALRHYATMLSECFGGSRQPPHLTTYLTTEADGLPRDSQVMAC